MEGREDELLNELLVIQTLVVENPCRMNAAVKKGISVAIKTLIGSHLGSGASREQAARYLERDVRTLTRWRELYEDFPKPRHEGHLEISYDWVELIKFKLAHPELFNRKNLV